MFKQQNDGSDWKFRSKGSNEVVVDSGSGNVTKTAGDSLEDLDGIGSSRIFSMAGIQPSRDGEDDEDKCIPQYRDEKENAS